MKKLITNKHTYIIDEVKTDKHKNCIYGYGILLSIYVGENPKTKALSGQFHFFSDEPYRIAREENVVSVTEPSQIELDFVELLKMKKSVGYSRKLAEQYNLEENIYFYEIQEKV